MIFTPEKIALAVGFVGMIMIMWFSYIMAPYEPTRKPKCPRCGK